ncbi:ATP-binding protein [Nonomuraea sp. KM88]|uniref:ATP-binding protein n=1 Tax=Nonomuraea sp. KM88 TaxID=3457427 RepID=UPI003FCE3B9A
MPPAPREDGEEAAALLRAWRERALLTQEQLAELAGLNERTVRRLEAGELRRPRSTSMRLIAEALELSEQERAALIRATTGAPGKPGLGRVRPQQLPADVAMFIGRTRELAVLDDVDGAATVVITAIDGMAGVGKTALAVRAAHQLAPRFPDGDLFIDLHGHTRDVAPADPADTLARMLGALGVPGESVPRDLDDRAALFRTVLAGRKMLIVLDNAADEAQVWPLLPGAGESLVLVTSRRRLVGLDGARTVSVDVLPLPDAVALFVRTAGADRVAGVPGEALAEVVRRCGLLPLAIRLAAARLKAHPSWQVDHLLARLEEQRRRLSELHAGQRSVTAALELSYRELPGDVRWAYRLLGLDAGTDITADAAAALLDTPVTRVGRLLDQLQEVHLLQEPVPGRYRFHDLVRAHAAATAEAEEPADDRREALTRLLDHYCRAATAAMDHLYPYHADLRPSLPTAAASDTAPAPGTVSMPDAGAWLDAELANLLALAQQAARHGLHRHVRHLSDTLHRGLRTRARFADAEHLHTGALEACRAAGDRVGEMEALIGLGDIGRLRTRYDQATEDITRALDIARAVGHRVGELRALNGLGMLCASRGHYEPAIGYCARALEIAGAIGHRSGELDALIGSGNVHRLMGQHEQGAANLAGALGIARSIGNRTSESAALIGLGHINLVRGAYGSATDYLTQALTLTRRTGHRLSEINCLTGLGHLYRVRGRYEQARDCYQQALDLAREFGNRNWQFEAVHAMGRLEHDGGQADRALDHHRRALDLATELGQPSDQARAHDGIARAHGTLGRPDLARRHWSAALAILTSLGTDRTEESGVDVGSIRARLDGMAAGGEIADG